MHKALFLGIELFHLLGQLQYLVIQIGRGLSQQGLYIAIQNLGQFKNTGNRRLLCGARPHVHKPKKPVGLAVISKFVLGNTFIHFT